MVVVRPRALGTLAAGADFVVAQMDCLRPGGVAVHTTEYLVSSDDSPRPTVEEGGTVFYRRSDIEDLVDRLHRAGHAIDMDYTLGTTPDDLHVDVRPVHGRPPADAARRVRDDVGRADRHQGDGPVRRTAAPLVAPPPATR